MKMDTMYEVVAGNGPNNLRVHGLYEDVGNNTYQLRFFRVSFDSAGKRLNGPWHRIAGNKRKDVGALPLSTGWKWIDEHQI